MAGISYPGQVYGTAPPAGSYVQNGQVFLPDGTPFLNAPAQSQAPVTPTPVNITLGGGGGLYNPGSGSIGTPPVQNPSQVKGKRNRERLAAQRNSVNAANYTPPEVNALTQISKIDPGLVPALQNLQNTYAGQITPAAQGTSTAQAGLNQTAAQYKSLYNQYAQQVQEAQNGQLPPGVLREIQQDVRGTQGATGNYNGVAQAVQEGMTTGAQGYNYLTQAQQNAANVTAAQQGLYSSNANYYQNVLGAANSYLQGGQNPYQYGTNYATNAFNQSQAAASGSQVPTYNPYQSSAPAFSYINPNTGAEFAQGTTNFMNAGTGATLGTPDTSGQYAGAAIGAIGSIAAGALAAFCWVAREVYGTSNPKWLLFRDWLLNRGPTWLLKLYARYGERFSHWLRYRPKAKAFIRALMDTIIAFDNKTKTTKRKTT